MTTIEIIGLVLTATVLGIGAVVNDRHHMKYLEKIRAEKEKAR